MATLTDLYDYLEKKNSKEHIDQDFPLSSFHPNEQFTARLEILTWWNIETLVEDKNVEMDQKTVTTYLDKRIKATNNSLLKYRYCYFSYLLSNDNRYAQRAIDSLMDCLWGLLPENKDDYPYRADDVIKDLMSLCKRIKYREMDARALIWKILKSDYGYRTKLFCIMKARELTFFPANDAEKIANICKSIFPMTKDGWRRRCRDLGLYYASKLQNKGKKLKAFFLNSLGDMEIEQVVDPATNPNNIAIPHMNDGHLEKAMKYYQEAGAKGKRDKAERLYRENKKKLIYPHFKYQEKTNERVLKYFEALKDELMERDEKWLIWNLVMPSRFLFPTISYIKEHKSCKESTIQDNIFENRLKDINGNSQKASQGFKMIQMYEIWLINLVKNFLLDVVLTAVQAKKLTYAKLKRWFLKSTSFGIPIEYARANQVITASWFSQIDYAVEALIRQYQRFVQGKQTDWRIPIDELTIRFEGILRDIVADCGGRVTKVDQDNNTSQILLDALLKEPKLLQIFTDDDIHFFEYVFLSKGRNIRNCVAHAFYIPQDYNIIQATLVFLCILRLAKYGS